MTRDATRQPDQDPALWDRCVADHEAVFEPLTDAFAVRALDALEPLDGARLLDVCAGTGGAALLAAGIRERAGDRRIAAHVADAEALDLPPDRYDAALSCFGIVLLPDPIPTLRAVRRALVTWTEPQRYELVLRVGAAVTRLEARLEAPSARELSRNLAFAPGLDALMAGLGADRAAVEAEFARALEVDQGAGPVSLGAVAQAAIARRTA